MTKLTRFPKLYKLTSSKKIQEWEIFTEGNKIIIIQGQIDGKKQRYEQTIKEGKNIGRANETTPEQQARLEAKSKWEHKHNKDYHLSVEECNQKVKLANAGGYLPMLAKPFQNNAERHLKYPCYVQPKLDGLRCIATKDKKGVQLWFRSGKEITTMGHIVDDLDLIMREGDIFDGELYIHGEDFNNFTGAIRANKNLNPKIAEKINYHIYDFPRINGYTEEYTYKRRLQEFRFYYSPFILNKFRISFVLTALIIDFDEAMVDYENFIKSGFEGIMFRNTDMPYEQKRSYNLLKYKEFLEEEFIIISIEEGKGILAGHVGAFICRIEPNRVLKDIGGKTYKFGNEQGIIRAKMEGTFKVLKYLFEHPEECLGKPLTIKYQNLSKDGIPRFPVGKAIRFDK